MSEYTYPSLKLSKRGVWFQRGKKLPAGNIAEKMWLGSKGKKPGEIVKLTGHDATRSFYVKNQEKSHRFTHFI